MEIELRRIIWSPDSLNLLMVFQKQVNLTDAYSFKTVWSKNVDANVGDGDFRQDGKQVVLAMSRKLVFINAETGEDTRQISCLNGFVFVRYSPDGQSVAFGDWESSRQEGSVASVYMTSTTEKCDATLLQKLDDKILYQIAFSSDGKYLMGDFSGLTFLWKTSNDQQYATFKSIHSSFNGDGSLLATKDNGEIVLWKVDTLKPIGFYKSYGWQFSLNPDGKILATTEYTETSDGNGWSIKLLDTKSGDVLKVIENLSGTPAELSFSPDGRLLAGLFDGETGSAPKKLVVWGVK
jgi:dipeptidyl aminopeptidase/acylaminoacyl peptidase